MKERPILFSELMIRALLDGSKTQTRRIVKPPLMCLCNHPIEHHAEHQGWTTMGACAPFQHDWGESPCPYGQPGDHLWVRETWRIGAWDEGISAIAIDYLADNYWRDEWLFVPDIAPPQKPGAIFKRQSSFQKYMNQSLDDAEKSGLKFDASGAYHWDHGDSPCRTRPTIHMPRWASRITLEVVNVRVERLQDISEADAEAEGWTGPILGRYTAYHWYWELWESINGKGSWDANPWVWVIEFRRAA